MADAAVIERVRAVVKGFEDAAPGHVFQLYLPMWKLDWSLDKNAKGEAARRSTRIPPNVKKLGEALRERQGILANACGAYTRKAQSTSPFATGLGNEHPIENGFAFLTPYGLPYLAGSGIKGVLRRAMQELGQEGDKRFDQGTVEALFGVEAVNQPEDARRGALDVWDCYPQVCDKLVVELMTPHFSGYYQKGETPHDAGQPNPVPFLAVPAGSLFDFHVVCHEGRLPEPLRGGRWETLLNAAFDHAFAWLGFGAKTSVGYGAMAEDPEEKKRRDQAQAEADAAAAQRAEAERLAAMSPADQEWDRAQPVLAAFRSAFDQAPRNVAFNPSGTFNQSRLNFMKTALAWTDTRCRSAAGQLLAETATKEWGRPSKKERWQELQQAVAALKGEG